MPADVGEPEAGLVLATSNRLDHLIDRLATAFAAAPLPPFEREVVMVQSQGLQRWLTLELARRDGVAASLSTPFPRPYCLHLVRRVLDQEDLPPSEEIPRDDGSWFGRQLLTWRLFSLLDFGPLEADSVFAVPAA
jgi:exodeoxyribonuclease V gamma subunit